MPPEHVAVLLPLLTLVVGGGFALLLMGLADVERPKGRDLDKEHQLGAHRHTPAWGCRRCKP